MKSKVVKFALIVATFTAMGKANAGVIVNDEFNDGSRAQSFAGLGAGTGGETEVPWFQNASTIAIATDNSSPLSGSTLQPAGTAVGTFGTGASNISLGVGDSITLTADFRFTTAGTANARFGLYNDNGTPAADAPAAGAPYTGDHGYLFIVLQSAGNNNYTEENDTGGALGGGTDQVNFAQSGSGRPAFGTTTHTVVFALTRTASGMQISGTVDGLSYGTSTDTTPTTTSFNEIVLNTTSVDIDNIQVTSNVPEPASAGLLLPGGLAFMARRRRLRTIA